MSLSQRLCENLHSRDAFVNGNIETLQNKRVRKHLNSLGTSNQDALLPE